MLKFLQVATVVDKDTDYCCSCKLLLSNFLFVLSLSSLFFYFILFLKSLTALISSSFTSRHCHTTPPLLWKSWTLFLPLARARVATSWGLRASAVWRFFIWFVGMKWFWIWGFWKLVIPAWVCGFISGVSNVGVWVCWWCCQRGCGSIVGGVSGVGVWVWWWCCRCECVGLMVVLPVWVWVWWCGWWLICYCQRGCSDCGEKKEKK